MEQHKSLDSDAAAGLLRGNAQLCPDELYLQMGDCRLRVRANSVELITELREYFAHTLGAPGEPYLDLVAIERDPPSLDLPFVDWAREPGKTGRKDAYLDLPDGRMVLKVRTGMVFLQAETQRIAAGPCVRYPNQVVNFINSQYMTWLQQQGWLICHASGLVYQGRCLAMAGFSGGGKSTLMLHLMEQPGVSYLTNDRLFVRREGKGVDAVGIPKLPRINPGTVVHNPRLKGLIPDPERARLLALPKQELWDIEDKYDVPVEQFYGPGSIVPQAPLAAFLILNWQRGSNEAPDLQPVDLNQRRDLLAAIMKSPGPFHQYADGSFHQDTAEFDEQSYLDALAGVPVFEIRGGIDFDAIIQRTLADVLA